MDEISGLPLQTFVQEILEGAGCQEEMIPDKGASSELGRAWTENGPSNK